MWTCQICGQTVENDTWERCWNCSSPKEQAGEEPTRELRTRHQEKTRLQVLRLSCPRCQGQNLEQRDPKAGGRTLMLRKSFFDWDAIVAEVCMDCGFVFFQLRELPGQTEEQE